MNYSRATVSSELRKKLQPAGFANAETFVPQHGNPVTFPMVRVGLDNREGIVDVCRYPIGFGAELNFI